ncbi:hypothetical protein CR513_22841, partial [Mucuna pruriens]
MEDALKILECEFHINVKKYKDAGFMLKHRVLTPYKGVCYHLKEHSAQGPQNVKKFNLHYSSHRNMTERTFRVIKKRFVIIGNGLVLACCILHNFLMPVHIDEKIIAQVDHELLQTDIDRSISQQRDEDYKIGANLRDNIAFEIWNAFENVKGK